MSKYQFFFVGSDGMVKRNDDVMPLELVKNACPSGLVMRFAFDPDGNRIYIQDESFRQLLPKGDEHAWHLVNQALYAMDEQSDKRFPELSFGDPIDSAVTRRLSQYETAWKKISKAMNEMGVEPLDMPVYEYVPTKERQSETVLLLPKGAMLGSQKADQATLGLNRMIHRALPEMSCGDDVDHELMSTALYCFYVDNLRKIMKLVGTKQAQKVLKATENVKLACRMFAMDMDGTTRIFKATQDEEGKYPTEASIKEKLPSYGGPIVMFDWGDNVVTLKNSLPSRMFKNPLGERIASDIRKALSRKDNVPPEDITFALDPSLDSPYAYDSETISTTLGCLCEGDKLAVDFIEVPGLDAPSIAVSDPKDEETKIPGFQGYRATRGVSIDYPFVAIRAEMSRGKKLGEMARRYRELRGDQKDLKGFPFVSWIRDEEARSSLRKKMGRMLRMGMSKGDILDIFSSEVDLLRRAEYGNVLDEACEEFCPKKVALAGHPIGVNDWWHLIVPEALNKADQKKQKVKVLNPEPGPKVPPEKAGIETLLERDRDERQAHKPIEQLLRDSMI